MRLTRCAPLAFAFLALASTAGCGDDATGTDDQFTDAEATELSDALSDIVALFDQLSGPGAFAADTRASEIAAVISQISSTRTCPVSGSASIAGTRNQEAAALDIDVTFTFSSCRARNTTVGGTMTLELHAAPSGANQATATVNAGGSLTATLQSGRTRTCQIDFTQTTIINTSTGVEDTTQSGTVCGRLANLVLNR